MLPARLDVCTLLAAASGFILFFILHVFMFRSGKAGAASRAISFSFATGLAGTFLIFASLAIFYLRLHQHFSVLLVAGAAALFVYVLLVFHYIAWIFGMGEAAIRIRLLNEIAEGGARGKSLEAICERYNVDTIMNLRLSRLVNAGHFKFDGRFYQMRGRILLLQIKIVDGLKALMGIRAAD